MVIANFSTYKIQYDPDQEKNKECVADLVQGLDIDASEDAAIGIAEDAEHTHVEDFWDWLEAVLANYPQTSLKIEGYIDASESSGEFEDFRFEVRGGELTAYRSGWYEETSKDSYEDYDDFCDYYENSDRSPICTREEFDAFDGEFIRIVGLKTRRILDEVPLDDPITSRNDLPNRGQR